MRLELNVSARLEQVLTSQLILNLKLLQLPALELEGLVRQELEENPALEVVEDSLDASSGKESPESDNYEGAAPAGSVSEEPALPDASKLDEYTIGDLMPDDGFMPEELGIGRSEEVTDAIELAAGPGPGLHETLLPRLRSVLSEDDARVAESVVDAIDDDGFFTQDEAEFSQNQGIEQSRLREILYLIQRIEPGGLGTRDQQQALAVQLELAGYRPESLEMQIVTTHWKLLLLKHADKIAKLCGVTQQDVRDAVSHILTLDPRPGRKFTGQATEYVSPDFSVNWRDGKAVAEPNDESFPRLRLSRRYVEILQNPKAFPKDQLAFAREKFRRALMFLRGIESRRRTVAGLAKLIVEQQREFFEKGPEFLKPATLKEAADRMGVHPSTASRAIAGKYLETCYGIFPFKHFFAAGTGDKSRASIKERVKAIIEAEDPKKPLSDDEICAMLEKEGTKIARRTVAKYRGELGILGKGQRGSL